MSLTINGVMPKTVRVETNGVTTDLNILKINKNGNDTYVWAKPYTLRLTSGTKSTLTVTRISSRYANAGLGSLYNLSEIYYGDEISITASASSGYKVSVLVNGTLQNSLSFTRTVNGDLSVSVQEKSTTPSLNSPQLSGSFTYDYGNNFYNLNLKIKNPNSVKVTAKITVYSNGGNLEEYTSRVIEKNAEITYFYGEMYSAGTFVVVELQNSGYYSSTSNITFGNFWWTTVGPTDETTTTTTTTTTT